MLRLDGRKCGSLEMRRNVAAMRVKSENRGGQNRKERVATWGRACCRVPPDIASSDIVQFLKEIAVFSGGQRTTR